MKFILTGCTGFIGGEVIYQCLRNPSITSVVALTRRKLPETFTTNPKLKEVVMKDFNAYPESVLKELSGADACIWYANLFLAWSRLMNIKGVWVQQPETRLLRLTIPLRLGMPSPKLSRRRTRSSATSTWVVQQPRGIRRDLYGSKEKCERWR